VANGGEATVTVIDGASNNSQTIAVAANPTSIALNPVTNQIYVSVGVFVPETNVTVIDGATNQTIATIPLDEFTPGPIAVNTAANEAYILLRHYHGSGVLILNGTTLQTSGVSGPDTLPPLASMAFNTRTNEIYLQYEDGFFYVIDRTTGEVSAKLTTSPDASTIVVDDAINQIYVTVLGESGTSTPGSVMVIDGASDAITTLQVGTYPVAAALNPATHRVYVANACGIELNCSDQPVSGTVSVIAAAQ
jgi:DNA-binding beta-propeller fold protein YncE